MYESINQQLFEYWKLLYRKSPAATAVGTVAGVIILSVVLYLANEANREKHKREASENASYKTQLEQIDNAERSLNGLLTFMERQKKLLTESEGIARALEAEHERLRPIVEADRQLVAAIYEVHEERNRAAVVRERWLGFGLGVLASLVASLLWYVISKIVNRKKQVQGAPAERPN